MYPHAPTKTYRYDSGKDDKRYPKTPMGSVHGFHDHAVHFATRFGIEHQVLFFQIRFGVMFCRV